MFRASVPVHHLVAIEHPANTTIGQSIRCCLADYCKISSSLPPCWATCRRRSNRVTRVKWTRPDDIVFPLPAVGFCDASSSRNIGVPVRTGSTMDESEKSCERSIRSRLIRLGWWECLPRVFLMQTASTVRQRRQFLTGKIIIASLAESAPRDIEPSRRQFILHAWST